jgi:hypothetical protein
MYSVVKNHGSKYYPQMGIITNTAHLYICASVFPTHTKKTNVSYYFAAKIVAKDT